MMMKSIGLRVYILKNFLFVKVGTFWQYMNSYFIAIIIYTMSFTAKAYLYGPVISGQVITKVQVDQFFPDL